MTNGKIIAFGLLTEGDLEVLGPSFSRAWPVDEAPCFTQLLEAIDEADRLHRLQGTVKSGKDRGADSYVKESNPIGAGRR